VSKANRIALQEFLNQRGAGLAVDGAVGPATIAALRQVFANPNAPAVTDDDIQRIAVVHGARSLQIKAVAAVESSGGGFLPDGRPKILFERHWVYRRLGKVLAAVGVKGAFLSRPDAGGYTLDIDKDGENDSWEKLAEVCKIDPVAAFESCSWGKFQIMGGHWRALGYPNVFDFAFSMSQSERGHYRALSAYISTNKLSAALRAISTNPATCEAFAKGYNGPAFRKHAYHEKLARAMRELGA
jgi:hypothetical protein